MRPHVTNSEWIAMVPLTPMIGAGSRSLPGRETQRAVTFTVRRRFDLPTFPNCSRLLWVMAILSLCLLPTDYRAGAATAHAHSLFQLWVDAADGGVFHDHAGQPATSDILPGMMSWFDPSFDLAHDHHTGAAQNPDVAHQHDSAPTVSGMDLLLATLSLLPLVAVARTPEPDIGRRLVGRSPRVLAPPPRGLLTTI